MAHTAHHDTTTRVSRVTQHWLTAVLAVVGVVAAAIGAWMAYGPDDATVRILGWTWNVADVSSLWAPWLMIGGGISASIGMAWEAFWSDANTNAWIRALEVLLLIAGLVAIGIGLFLLF